MWSSVCSLQFDLSVGLQPLSCVQLIHEVCTETAPGCHHPSTYYPSKVLAPDFSFLSFACVASEEEKTKKENV